MGCGGDILLAFCFAMISICAKFADDMKITKSRYILSFLTVTLLLALVRCVFPSIASDRHAANGADSQASSTEVSPMVDDGVEDGAQVVGKATAQRLTALVPLADTSGRHAGFFRADGSLLKNRIYSVPGFSATFPDQNDVQLEAAQKYGVKPVADSRDAEHRKSELVYVGSNAYFHVDKLRNSIPYLVPRASVLLQDIGHSFFDSLQIKGIPLHQVIVTSVLRSKADVEMLRGKNSNATQNSCHLYGTTFDVCYNRYKTVEAPNERRRAVRNDTLKWVLAEVLRDMRQSGRCYVKYEVHQGCFHITVR